LCHSVYSHVEALLPRYSPNPLGKVVTTITYTNTNLYHDMPAGRSVICVIRP
jgi:hypothetical protein